MIYVGNYPFLFRPTINNNTNTNEDDDVCVRRQRKVEYARI